MDKKTKAPWKICAGVASAVFITAMWIKKDTASLFATMPREQWLPLFTTTATVTLLKVGGIAAVLFLVKYLINKCKRPKQ